MTGINVGGPDGCHDDAPGDHSCDALAGIPELLITGSHTAQADFKHYVEKHRPAPGACRTWGVEAKFGPSEDSFRRICRPIAVAMGQKAGEKWTAAAKLQPTFPKPDRLLVPQITGYETVDHPSDAQLVALARKYFVKFDRMAGGPTPT